jgi:signal transduction histidine kinase
VSQPPRQPTQHRQPARSHEELPKQRTEAGDGPTGPAGPDRGGSALVAHTLIMNDSMADDARGTAGSPDTSSAVRRLLTRFRGSRLARGIASDVLALVIAVLDVWLVFPEKAQTYSVVLSTIACAAMLLRRKWPFLAVLVTVPGFLAGWAQLAAMIALGTLAKRRQLHYLTWIAFGLVFACRFILWPLEDFVAQSWREHVQFAIYGIVVAGMPMALGLLISVRQELSARIRQLAVARSRESKLQEETVRAAERARLAREMHDVVSHQVTLIAMQAGALQTSAPDEQTRQAADTIRELSTHTLEELRNLVGVLRSGPTEDESQPGIDELAALARDFDGQVTLAMEGVPEQLPPPVSQAAYRTVQEALTNVRKHAGGAGASVRVVGHQDSLLVEVSNDRPRKRSSGLPSGGHGLLGLRERTGLLGGTFHAGPTPEGGFRVEATYPIHSGD